ncbi:hypothetical protein ONZ43_g30 [Nemania bipapillata]|uniref:Uncharacterized protein n=1 Tax=Nemania bipapillata TaxID=110536 RepID=A0ACC2J9M5_9PEZI|nr:hypothetical protein ONZ43_g30 [Nemania bipapillata]
MRLADEKGRGKTVGSLVDLARSAREDGLEGQLQALQTEFGLAPLEIAGEKGKAAPLDIGASTLWLVLKVAGKEEY